MKGLDEDRAFWPWLALCGGCAFLIGLGFLMGYDTGKHDLRQIQHELEWSIEDLKSCDFLRQSATANETYWKQQSIQLRERCLETSTP